MKVKVNTKYEMHIYVMLALQYMHDNFCWALHTKWYSSSVMDRRTDGRTDGRTTRKHNVPPVTPGGDIKYLRFLSGMANS